MTFTRKSENRGSFFRSLQLVLVGHRARELNVLLSALEKALVKYSLKLKYDKCNYIAMNGHAHTHPSDSRPMKQVDKATYLGSEISQDAGRWTELNNRMNIAWRTFNKLKTFWYKTDCSCKWKLQVYNAVIVAQITCGVNTVHLTPAMMKRLGAFQIRGCRYILEIQHAFYSGTSNKEVYDKNEHHTEQRRRHKYHMARIHLI